MAQQQLLRQPNPAIETDAKSGRGSHRQGVKAVGKLNEHITHVPKDFDMKGQEVFSGSFYKRVRRQQND
jgi:hypothetical protein